jgi:hypothetical protein
MQWGMCVCVCAHHPGFGCLLISVFLILPELLPITTPSDFLFLTSLAVAILSNFVDWLFTLKSIWQAEKKNGKNVVYDVEYGRR